MSDRVSAILGAMGSIIAITFLAPTPAAGQASTAAAGKSWTTPRTPDGQPDLRGIWTNKTTTPLERPSKYAGKAVLTDEELAQEAKEVADAFAADLQGREVRSHQEGAVTDVGRAYNAHWFDRSGKPINRTSLITDPPDGKIPPLKPEAAKRFAAWAKAKGAFGSAATPDGLFAGGGRPEGVEDGTEGGEDGRGTRADNPEDRRLSERCLLWANGLPRLPGGYNADSQIVQTPTSVVIQMEMIHDARVIPLDGRPHLPKGVGQWLGDPRGRWEGDTLVIDTTNFTDKAPFRGSFEGLHLIERLTRVDADTINYEVTVDDPTAFTRSWTASWPLTRLQPSEDVKVPQMFEYACHEGNYGLEGQLSSARAVDRQRKVATAAGKTN